MNSMMSRETQTFLETALESLKKDILRSMEAHTRDRNVPCTGGLREFQHLVSLYWDLEARVAQKRHTDYNVDQPEAMCEAMPEAPVLMR